MNASPQIEYKWADGKKVVRALDVSAPQYVRYLNEWIEEQVGRGKGWVREGRNVFFFFLWLFTFSLLFFFLWRYYSSETLLSSLGLENLAKKLFLQQLK